MVSTKQVIKIKKINFICYLFLAGIFNESFAQNNNDKVLQGSKKDQLLDFSASVIEGDLNRPSILMELGNNINDIDDLVHLRKDFNSFHKIDMKYRIRYFKEDDE